MFSTTSLNPLISSSSSSSSSSSYVDLSPYIIHHPEPDHNTSLHHHQNPFSNLPLISETCILPLNSNNAISSKQVTNGDFCNHYGFGTSSVSLADKRPPPKKDRHSKIYTAQGLRDRRVRMSIEIARKFFDLQDLLGFDKASKTLDWLLTKSKKAIKELAQNDNLINNNTQSLSLDSMCEQVVSENGELEEEDADDDEEEEDNTNSNNEKDMKRMKKEAAAASNLQVSAKELREKARARARERTRIKLMCSSTSKFNEPRINLDPTSQTLNQSKSILLNHHPFQFHHHHQQSSSSSSSCNHHQNYLNPSHHHHQANQEPQNSTIGESILIKRKLKQSTMMGYQQNFIFLKDPNFNNYVNSLTNLPPNWNNNNTPISLCAITSMNRSPGAHHLHDKLNG